MIYDNLNAAKKSLSKHLLLRDGVVEAKKGTNPSRSLSLSHLIWCGGQEGSSLPLPFSVVSSFRHSILLSLEQSKVFS